MLLDVDEEFSRRGNFEMIFPLAINSAFYLSFFEYERYHNALVAAYLRTDNQTRLKLLAPKYRRIHFTDI